MRDLCRFGRRDVGSRRPATAKPLVYSSPRSNLPATSFIRPEYPAEIQQTSTMPLELRPNCEYCDVDLPPSSTEARICSYECTFCSSCNETKLFNVCPNCGGGLEPRPIRPTTEWREGLCVAKQPPSTKRINLKRTVEDVAAHVERIKGIKSQDR